uniref:Uncharacterized protein n=1 Tax=Timema cristinae TaxID=61476 RepID=A0A7R9CT05_TIMCR|nr:unnamed protein product [Timema cristinae]
MKRKLLQKLSSLKCMLTFFVFFYSNNKNKEFDTIIHLIKNKNYYYLVTRDSENGENLEMPGNLNTWINCKVGDQDKNWAPQICCSTCVKHLTDWVCFIINSWWLKTGKIREFNKIRGKAREFKYLTHYSLKHLNKSSSGVVAGHIFRTDRSNPTDRLTNQMPDSYNPATHLFPSGLDSLSEGLILPSKRFGSTSSESDVAPLLSIVSLSSSVMSFSSMSSPIRRLVFISVRHYVLRYTRRNKPSRFVNLWEQMSPFMLCRPISLPSCPRERQRQKSWEIV